MSAQWLAAGLAAGALYVQSYACDHSFRQHAATMLRWWALFLAAAVQYELLHARSTELHGASNVCSLFDYVGCILQRHWACDVRSFCGYW
jgi:hypothetical protein